MRLGSICALGRFLSWCNPRGIVLRARHIPGHLNVIADKLSRHNQVIQTEWSISRQVFNLLCSRWAQPHVGLFATRLNVKLPQICITGTGSTSLGSRHPESAMGESGCLRLPSSLPAQPSNSQGDGSRLSQDDSDCSRVAQHPLVWGPDLSVGSDPFQVATTKGCGDTTLQPTPSPEPQQSEPICLAPRASAIKKQRFSDEVGARIEAPQRLNQSRFSKWGIFVKWCKSNKVDFWSTSVNQIAKERELQPGTIEGYRRVITDIACNDRVNSSKDENVTRLLESCHRGKPKGRRGMPIWNLSLVLYQLTKAPFEPMQRLLLNI